MNRLNDFSLFSCLEQNFVSGIVKLRLRLIGEDGERRAMAVLLTNVSSWELTVNYDFVLTVNKVRVFGIYVEKIYWHDRFVILFVIKILVA